MQWRQELFFWRSAEKHEVDFVSYGPLGLFAFEIKGASVVREGDLKGLRTFRSDYPMARGFLFYGGERTYQLDGITLMGFEEGLRKLPEIFGVPL